MERQLINQGYIIALIPLCRLKMERQLINQSYIIAFIISMTKLLDADWSRGVQLFH